jgi:hypothetical protein
VRTEEVRAAAYVSRHRLAGRDLDPDGFAVISTHLAVPRKFGGRQRRGPGLVHLVEATSVRYVPGRKMRRLLLVGAGFAIFSTSFYASLSILDKSPVPAAKSDAAKALAVALENYRAARGIYPIFLNIDVPLSELESSLTNARIISALPAFEWIKQSRYVSGDGNSYGLLIAKNPPCIVEVNISKSTWWGQPPACPEF